MYSKFTEFLIFSEYTERKDDDHSRTSFQRGVSEESNKPVKSTKGNPQVLIMS